MKWSKGHVFENAGLVPMNWAYFKSKASVLIKIPRVNALRGVPFPHFTGEAAQIAIARKITECKGCLIARVGETEGCATAHYLRYRLGLPSEQEPYEAGLMSRLKLLAGYFPISDETVDRLAQLYISAISSIDIYAAWTRHDGLLCPLNAARVRLIDLDPFFTFHRWTLSLEGRRVCIVSPFTDTMRAQYPNRSKFFPVKVIPDMDLTFVKAPMTQCETNTNEQNWFDNLAKLTDLVLESRSEVVIIGAGAYGLPLGAIARDHKMVAIVLGGSTQLLFGIKGNRWENDRQYRRIFNEYWVKPSEMERPPGFQNFEIEGGAYW